MHPIECAKFSSHARLAYDDERQMSPPNCHITGGIYFLFNLDIIYIKPSSITARGEGGGERGMDMCGRHFSLRLRVLPRIIIRNQPLDVG